MPDSPDSPDDLTPAAAVPPGMPDLSTLGGAQGEGGLDMGSLLGMAMDMQQQLVAAQESAAQTVVEGQAGGGVVRIAVTGDLVFQSVTIDPEAVDPDDVEMLQDLVLAALHDAVVRVNELALASNPMAAMGMGGLGDLGSLSDLGGLGGLLGITSAQGDDDDDEDDGDDAADDDDHDDEDDDDHRSTGDDGERDVTPTSSKAAPK